VRNLLTRLRGDYSCGFRGSNSAQEYQTLSPKKVPSCFIVACPCLCLCCKCTFRPFVDLLEVSQAGWQLIFISRGDGTGELACSDYVLCLVMLAVSSMPANFLLLFILFFNVASQAWWFLKQYEGRSGAVLLMAQSSSRATRVQGLQEKNLQSRSATASSQVRARHDTHFC